MGFLDRRTLSVLLTIAVTVGVIALIWAARRPVMAFIFAIFFAHLLEPVVGRFEEWLHLSRGKAVAVTYLAMAVGLLVFGLTVGPRVIHQGARLPSLLEKVKSGSIAWQVGSEQGWSRATEARIQNWLATHQNDIARYAGGVTDYVAQAASNLAWILLVPVLAVFFLKDRSKLGASVVQLLGASHRRKFLASILSDLDSMLGQYIRAQLLLVFFAFVAYGVFLLIARVPYAFAVAAIAGVLEFIPIAGPLMALGILMGIAFLTGYSHWLVLAGFWIVWRGIQDYVNTPRVMGKGLDLHPLLSIFAILVGGELGGVIGIFLSIPAVAALRILWINWTHRGFVRKAA
ncbi:MAG TPA: AI-2E family transporter [Terriglobia bacterium]|jgi:predicted PurR-regulated permease PerM